MKDFGLPVLDFGLGVALAVAVSMLVAGVALAQEGYDLSWWTADGGGQTFSTGGGYSLGGTIGQPDAGVTSSPGYTIAGGFWSGRTAIYRVYLPVVLRSSP
jgi:hypothetical protein